MQHLPVMAEEVRAAFAAMPADAVLVDATQVRVVGQQRLAACRAIASHYPIIGSFAINSTQAAGPIADVCCQSSA